MAAKRIKSAKVRDLLGQVMEEVYYKGHDYIVEKGNKEVAAIISIDEYKRIQREREEDFTVFEEIWKENKNFSSLQVKEDASQAIKEARKKKNLK